MSAGSLLSAYQGQLADGGSSSISAPLVITIDDANTNTSSSSSSAGKSSATTAITVTVRSLEQALYAIPKTDFHCHLNGSISVPLLAHLERISRIATTTTTTTLPTSTPLPVNSSAKSGGGGGGSGAATSKEETILVFDSAAKRQSNILSSTAGNDNSSSHNAETRMQYCFAVFDNIYKLMTNLAFTRLAVQDMVLCSAAERVFAMEIRTSLRDGMTMSFAGSPSPSPASGSIDNSNSIRGVASAATAAAVEKEKECWSRVVTKREYVDAVVATVGHLLGSPSGVICFSTGKLLERPTPAWEADFSRIYGFLLLQQQPRQSHQQQKKDDCRMEEQRMHTVMTNAVAFAKSSMHVRLLVSVNRSGTVAAAHEATAIATAVQSDQLRDFYRWCVSGPLNSNSNGEGGVCRGVSEVLRATCWVTGIDLSGHCYKGSFNELEPIFSTARAGNGNGIDDDSGTTGGSINSTAVVVAASLGLTYHGGEKDDAGELAAMIASGPERWGHLVFTDPLNRAAILRRHDAIELCITSNLLTGGHNSVRDHHITGILDTWRQLRQEEEEEAKEEASVAMGQSGGCECLVDLLCNEGVYTCSAQLRLNRRLQRHSSDRERKWNQALMRSVAAGAIPNISFHTDDRGVFGTTAAHELLLASQHPLINGNATPTPPTTVPQSASAPSVTVEVIATPITQQEPASEDKGDGGGLSDADTRVVTAMRLLARLSLLNVFEVHWAVVLLALYVEHKQQQQRGTANTSNRNSDNTCCSCAASSLESAVAALAESEGTWSESWPAFVAVLGAIVNKAEEEETGGSGDTNAATGTGDAERKGSGRCACGTTTAATTMSLSLPARLSALESRWLTECFDRAA